MELNDFYNKYAEDMAVIRSNQHVHDERLTKMEKDIEALQKENKAIYEINTNVRLLAESMTTVKQDIAETKENIKEVKSTHIKLGERVDKEISAVREDINDVRSQPEKAKAAWWDKVVWLVAGGFISAALAIIIEKM